jgi:hypothetical protein
MGEGACGATLRTLDWTDSNIPGRDEGELKPGAEAAPWVGLRPEESPLNLDSSNSAARGRRSVSFPCSSERQTFRFPMPLDYDAHDEADLDKS